MYFLLIVFRCGCIIKGFTDSVDHIDIKGINYVFTSIVTYGSFATSSKTH